MAKENEIVFFAVHELVKISKFKQGYLIYSKRGYISELPFRLNINIFICYINLCQF